MPISRALSTDVISSRIWPVGRLPGQEIARNACCSPRGEKQLLHVGP
jgi:hypothetical protein